MYINDIKNKKGFDNVDWLEKNPGIKFNKDTIFVKKYLDLNKNENYKDVIISSSSVPLYIVDENLYNDEKTNAVKYEFVDSEKKVLITICGTFFHFFMDSISSILILNNKYPGIKFIIDFADFKNNQEHVYLSLLKDFLNLNNINHVLLETNFVIKINNFFKIDSLTPSDFTINEIYNFSQKYVKEKNKIPTKKVYISRKYTQCNRDTDLFENAGIDIEKVGYSDIRVYNEPRLESFFRSIGFEIVYAEKFNSIEEQINYFNDVIVLVGATSSGLLNSIFMPSGGLVVELMTPFIPGLRDIYELHSSQYLEMSYSKKHNYLGVPSKFYAKDIAEYFLTNPEMFNFIKRYQKR